jgi:hypothetical protein
MAAVIPTYRNIGSVIIDDILLKWSHIDDLPIIAGICMKYWRLIKCRYQVILNESVKLLNTYLICRYQNSKDGIIVNVKSQQWISYCNRSNYHVSGNRLNVIDHYGIKMQCYDATTLQLAATFDCPKCYHMWDNRGSSILCYSTLVHIVVFNTLIGTYTLTPLPLNVTAIKVRDCILDDNNQPKFIVYAYIDNVYVMFRNPKNDFEDLPIPRNIEKCLIHTHFYNGIMYGWVINYQSSDLIDINVTLKPMGVMLVPAPNRCRPMSKSKHLEPRVCHGTWNQNMWTCDGRCRLVYIDFESDSDSLTRIPLKVLHSCLQYYLPGHHTYDIITGVEDFKINSDILPGYYGWNSIFTINVKHPPLTIIETTIRLSIPNVKNVQAMAADIWNTNETTISKSDLVSLKDVMLSFINQRWDYTTKDYLLSVSQGHVTRLYLFDTPYSIPVPTLRDHRDNGVTIY